MTNIAWLTGRKKMVGALMNSLETAGMTISHYVHAGPAVHDLTKERKYDLIVLDPEIAPGIGYNYPRMEEIMQTTFPNYVDIGHRVVELVRQEGSLNQRTPIAVVGIIRPYGDNFMPDAKQRFINAGANSFHYLMTDTYYVVGSQLERLALGRT